MSAWGHGFLLLATIGMAAVTDRREALLLGPLLVLVVLRLDRGALRAVLRPTALVLLGMLLVLGPALAVLSGEAPDYLRGLPIAAALASRALALLVAVSLLSRNVSVDALATLLERLGMPELGFVAGVALNLLATVTGAARDASDSVRMRGGYRRHPIRNLKLVYVAAVIHAVHRADQVVLAARVRAYQPGLRTRSVPAPNRIDWAVLGLAAALGTAIKLLA